MERVERIGRTLKYEGKIVSFYEDDMKMPNGNVAKWDFIVHRNGAAAVLPVLENGHVLMVRQYRPAIEGDSLEIPAGAKNFPEEPSIECAARELEEETGYRAKDLVLLCRNASAPAFCNELLDIYLATDLVRTKQKLDEDEFLNVEEWDVKDLVEEVYAGHVLDSKSSVAILTYYSKYYLK